MRCAHAQPASAEGRSGGWLNVLWGLPVFKEFREFAFKGNVIDLAIGVIIGAAFGTIVSSVVDDIFMPIIALIVGQLDFSGVAIGPIQVGLFISAVVKFVIIAFVLFLVVKAINAMKRKEEAAPSAPPPPTKEEILLTEIRDTLRAQSGPRTALMAAPKTPSVSSKAAAKPAAKKPAAKAAAAKPATKAAAAKPAARAAAKPAARKPAAKPAAAAKKPVAKAAAKPAAKKPAAKAAAAKPVAAKKPAAKPAAKKPAGKK